MELLNEKLEVKVNGINGKANVREFVILEEKI
jgi:hypothetical protein